MGWKEPSSSRGSPADGSDSDEGQSEQSGSGAGCEGAVSAMGGEDGRVDGDDEGESGVEARGGECELELASLIADRHTVALTKAVAKKSGRFSAFPRGVAKSSGAECGWCGGWFCG